MFSCRLVAAGHDAFRAAAIDRVFRAEELFKLRQREQHFLILNAVRAAIKAGVDNSEDEPREIERFRTFRAVREQPAAVMAKA